MIGKYVVDFYCSSSKIVIELDGLQHYTNQGIAHDEERTKVFEKQGIYVLRFLNKDVEDDFDGVCRMIDGVINERLKNLP